MSVIAVILAYLLGSIPFGLLLTRAAGMGDVRAIGSGNIGATNVLRTGNKKLALLTLLLDAAKGFTAVLLARHMAPEAAALAGLAAILGHVFPVWLRFKGGKGVATAFGILFGLSLPLALTACAVWLIIFIPMRIVSLASMISLVVAALVACFIENIQALPLLIVAALIIYTHRANIKRLMDGTEHRFRRTS